MHITHSIAPPTSLAHSQRVCVYLSKRGRASPVPHPTLFPVSPLPQQWGPAPSPPCLYLLLLLLLLLR